MMLLDWSFCLDRVVDTIPGVLYPLAGSCGALREPTKGRFVGFCIGSGHIIEFESKCIFRLYKL